MPLPSFIGMPKPRRRRFPWFRVAVVAVMILLARGSVELVILVVGFEAFWFQFEGMADRER